MACLFTSAAWLARQGQPGAAEGAALATEEEQLEEEEEERNMKRDVPKGCPESQEARRSSKGERGKEVRGEQFT